MKMVHILDKWRTQRRILETVRERGLLTYSNRRGNKRGPKALRRKPVKKSRVTGNKGRVCSLLVTKRKDNSEKNRGETLNKSAGKVGGWGEYSKGPFDWGGEKRGGLCVDFGGWGFRMPGRNPSILSTRGGGVGEQVKMGGRHGA